MAALPRAAPSALVFLLMATISRADLGALAEESPIGPTFERSGIRCPATFQGGMPPGVFCVYEGVAIAVDGQPCRERRLVIWTRMAAAFIDDGDPEPDGVDRDSVYFGIVMSPEIVIRATPGEQPDHATVHDYFLTPDSPREPLRGDAQLRFVRIADGTGIEVLSLRFASAISVSDRCALTVYEGSFVGLMILPLQ
jgi:hypothetical protein